MLLLVYLGLASCVSSTEDFRTYDYCKLNCKDAVHSACKCTVVSPREEVVTDPDPAAFRQIMLDAHNKRRSFIATGQEKRPEEGVLGTAANMMIINYDLELEHIARCYAINSYQKLDQEASAHDKCKARIGNRTLGQNIHGNSRIQGGDVEQERGWYEELKDITADRIEKHKKSPAGLKIGHFTQLVWWSANMLGCVRVWKPDNMNPYKYSLICNYGTNLYDVDKNASGGNHIGRPVYKKGPPCSACPKGHECDPENNATYPGLCGKLYPIISKDPSSEPISTSTEESPKQAADFNRANRIILLMFVLSVVY